MSTPDRVANLIRLLEDQPSTLKWFPQEQAYLREHQRPALVPLIEEFLRGVIS